MAALLLASVIGWPLRILVCVLEWDARDYTRVERFVAEHIDPRDRVAMSYAPYYPVARIADAWYSPYSLGHEDQSELDQVTCIIVRPDAAERMIRRIGGQWMRVAEYKAELPDDRFRLGRAQLYHLEVYRRSWEF